MSISEPLPAPEPGGSRRLSSLWKFLIVSEVERHQFLSLGRIPGVGGFAVCCKPARGTSCAPPCVRRLRRHCAFSTWSVPIPGAMPAHAPEPLPPLPPCTMSSVGDVSATFVKFRCRSGCVSCPLLILYISPAFVNTTLGN